MVSRIINWKLKRSFIDVFDNTAREILLPGPMGRSVRRGLLSKTYSLLEDGCTERIRYFWIKRGKYPALDYYPDPDGEVGTRCWLCDVRLEEQS